MRSIFYIGILGVGLVLGFILHREWQDVGRTIPNSWYEDQTADCGIVLTGGPGRIREGFDLLSQRAVQKLIISGVHHKSTLREIFPLWPYYGSLSESDVVLERRSGTTYGNAQQSLPLVEALHCKNVVVITSQLHMHRSLKTFRAIFPPEIEIKGRAIVAGTFHPKVWDHGMETLKSLFYALWAY
jgi:uncharacterized SAM-binding protein YcdF (DUF218 family)